MYVSGTAWYAWETYMLQFPGFSVNLDFWAPFYQEKGAEKGLLYIYIRIVHLDI
jgi:hypothetical protein